MPYQGSGDGGSKPKPKPTIILPWLVPQPKPKPESHSNPNVAVPGDFLSPAPATPQTPSTANPPAERPTYGPENPAPPNYGGPGPVYPGISSAPKPTSSSSSGGKKPDREKETQSKPHIAVPADMIQSEATPDISAFDLELGWSSHQLELGSDDELVAAVAKSVQHEGLFEHYYDDLKAYLKNFASYGWDGKADRQAEAYLQKYIEEMRLHYVDQAKREEWLELADSPSVTAWKQHAAKSGIERVLVIDANTLGILHDQPGVVGDGGHQTAGLQDYVVDVLRQFKTIYIHNHPNGTGASAADLDSAFAAGADMLIVVTDGGYEEVYIRRSFEMELARRGAASYEVGPLTTGEYVAQVARSQRQARLEAVDPAEYVFPEDEPPRLKDYIFHRNTRHSGEPDIKRDYARFDPLLFLFRTLILRGTHFDTATHAAVQKFAESAANSGFDMAGELLQHNLGSSGEPFRIPVDEMIAELPGLRESIMNYVDVELDNYFLSSNAQESALSGGVVEEVGNHTIYSFSLPWKEVGIGGNAEENIYDFDDDDLPLNYSTIYGLATGQPPLDHIPQEQYDWFLAVNKIHYYPRIAMVVDNTTGIAEVGLVIEVRDHYAWYVNEETGLLNSTMASMERIGLGRNFPVSGRSSLMIGSYNLNEGTAKNGSAHHELTIDGWDNDE